MVENNLPAQFVNYFLFKEGLFYKFMPSVSKLEFDAIIVGSGFGGSVMTARLARAGLKVLLLERGQAWAPGSFPRYPREFHQALWDPSRNRYGLFNLWSFPGIDVVTSSGLGGGSLLYANVLLRMDRSWFLRNADENWPIAYEDLVPHYERVEEVLGARALPLESSDFQIPKTLAFRNAAQRAGLDWKTLPLAVSFAASIDDSPAVGVPLLDAGNLHGKPRVSCRLCGECDVGCNYGSKNTLDLNYLSSAKLDGAEIRTLAQVVGIRPDDEGYSVEYVQHLVGSGRPTRDLQITSVGSRRLILAMGSPGTPHMLLKNQGSFPNLSRQLGKRFAGNGDYLGFVRNIAQPVDPYRGPVITSAVRIPDYADGGNSPGVYVEDAGFPNFLAYFVESLVYNRPATFLRVLRFAFRYLTRFFGINSNSSIGRIVSDLIGKDSFTANSLPLLGMGRDTPDGNLFLKEGRLQSDWTMRTSKKYFKSVKATMQLIAREMGGTFFTNPMSLLNKVVSVHPLGGCSMGLSVEDGVVDSYGEVFNYPGLFVADGSIMPGPVGANPSLTIAALADRSADRVIEKHKAEKNGI